MNDNEKIEPMGNPLNRIGYGAPDVRLRVKGIGNSLGTKNYTVQNGNLDKSVAIQENGDILVNGELTTDNDLIVETLKEIAKINLTR
jgi:hypothetical protein